MGTLLFATDVEFGWVAVGLCLTLVTAVVGFVAGMLFARSAGQRSLERTKRNLSALYDHVVQSIDVAQQACKVLETFPHLQLSLEQMEKLDVHRQSLVETIERIANGQETPPESEPDEPGPIDFPPMAWVRAPEHLVTRIPDRTAFDANIDLLLKTGVETGLTSGLLLVQMDKVDDLKKRFGVSGIQSFQKRMASLILRSMREADILCAYAAESFAVLMPGVDAATGIKAAEAIRQSIRRHHYRPNDKGPEVLVTASFGLAITSVEDTPDHVRSRAEAAVARSQKRGRNQLHCDNGRELTLCKTC